MYDEYFFDSNPYKEIIWDFKLDGIEEYFATCYDENDTEEVWFSKMKEFASKYKYTANRKEYKENPENFAGTFASFCKIIRLMLTTTNMSPNLYDILKLLGKDRINKRLELFINSYTK